MPSPFPGMDPYLELNPLWQRFHGWFVRKLAEISLPRARQAGCWIDVDYSVYQREPSGELTLLGEPDDTLALDRAAGPLADAGGVAAVAVARPHAVREVALDPATLERFKQHTWSCVSWTSIGGSWQRWKC